MHRYWDGTLGLLALAATGWGRTLALAFGTLALLDLLHLVLLFPLTLCLVPP
jgi:hypothetical protein